MGALLKVKTAAWKPSGVKLTYTWLRNGKKIAGATKSSYRLTAKERGKRVSVRVTGSKKGYATVARTSTKSIKVKYGNITASKPRIIGGTSSGQTLTAQLTTWKPSGLKFTYAWLRNGKKIAGATKSNYTLGTADIGTKISVKVTGKKSGYKAKSQTSAKTSTVTSFYTAHYGTFATATYTGAGDRIITLPANRKAVVITANHSGNSNFSIVSRTADFSYGDLLVNEIGNYSGTTAAGLSENDDPTRILEVEADGAWSITVRPVDTLTSLPSSGSGDAVYRYDGGSKVVGLTHSGSSNFIVSQHYIDREYGTRWTYELMVNEIGWYSGSRFLRTGPSIVQIEADGAWSIG